MTGYDYGRADRPHPAVRAAREAAEAVRDLNHATLQAAAGQDRGLSVVTLYDVLAALTPAAERLPQALTQLDQALARLVDHDRVRVVDGDTKADPVAMAVAVSVHLDTARAKTAQAADALNDAFQALTWAAPADPDDEEPRGR